MTGSTYTSGRFQSSAAFQYGASDSIRTGGCFRLWVGDADHQRGEGGEPGGVRRDLEAAGDDRVGMTGCNDEIITSGVMSDVSHASWGGSETHRALLITMISYLNRDRTRGKAQCS
jgi:hypothetical protein